MIGLSPIALGMVGLGFSLFVNGLNLLGVFDRGNTAEDPTTTETVAVVGSLAAAISVSFLALWLIIGAPFGDAPEDVRVQILFAALAAKFAFLWIALVPAQLRGWNLKPLGAAAGFACMLQIIEIIVLASWGLDLHTVFVELVLITYVLVLAGFALLPFGLIAASWVGIISIVSAFATLYIQFVSGGIIPPPTG